MSTFQVYSAVKLRTLHGREKMTLEVYPDAVAKKIITELREKEAAKR